MEEAPRGGGGGGGLRAPGVVLQMPRVLGVPAHPCVICVCLWEFMELETARSCSKQLETA
eukprot:571068-Alexandrium_andersonii.AAC.1